MAIEILTIPEQIMTDMILHCELALPNEACGILAGCGGEVSTIYTVTNIDPSPVSYLMDTKEQFRIMKDMREKGLSMLSIFHSHPSSPAYPSAKDVSLAFYDDCIYIIISFIESEPVIKGFKIKDAKVEDIAVVIKSSI
jgi:proteasome lid subunit RPN8/RPN11